MVETLKDVGQHRGTSGDGHYEAIAKNDGRVTITTRLDSAEHTYTVSLTRKEWDRLVAWVDWQRKK